jgi:hypothetical protein
MPNLPPLPLIDGCLWIDNSSWIEEFSTCYRRLQYRSLAKRVSAADKPALNLGTAFHMAMELRYSLYQNKPVDEQYYNDLSTILTEFFESHPPPADDWRNLNWCMEIVRHYNDKNGLEEFSLLTYNKPIICPHCAGMRPCLWCRNVGTRSVMVELPFAVPLFTWQNDTVGDLPQFIPVMYSGRIDLPHVLDGSVWVKDYKTSSMMGDMFWNEMRMSSQQKGYVWAFSKLTGLDVKGYVVDGIRTKEPPQYVLASKQSTKGKSQSPEQWWNESLVRERFYCDSAKLAEWHGNVVDMVEEFLWHYQRDYMPMKTKWCSQYGKCTYFDVCQLDPTDRPMLLASGQFTDNIWSPLNKV